MTTDRTTAEELRRLDREAESAYRAAVRTGDAAVAGRAATRWSHAREELIRAMRAERAAAINPDHGQPTPPHGEPYDAYAETPAEELGRLRRELAELDHETPEHRATLDRIAVLVREAAEQRLRDRRAARGDADPLTRLRAHNAAALEAGAAPIVAHDDDTAGTPDHNRRAELEEPPAFDVAEELAAVRPTVAGAIAETLERVAELEELAELATVPLARELARLEQKRARILAGPSVGQRRALALIELGGDLDKTRRALELARKHNPTRRAILAKLGTPAE